LRQPDGATTRQPDAATRSEAARAKAKRGAGGWSMMDFPRRPPARTPAAPWKRFLFQE